MVTKPAGAASARLLLAAVLVEIDEKYPSDFSEGAGAPSRLTLRLDSSSFWQLPVLPAAAVEGTAGGICSSSKLSYWQVENPTCLPPPPVPPL